MPTLKHTIICALLLLLAAGLAAQTEKWDWSLRAGGFNDDLGEAIATDAEGNCYVAGSFISNAGFIVTDDGVVVVDALGSPALAQAMIAEIRKVTSQPIRYVILTHYHADHIYGLQVFKAAGATVISHQEGREYLNSETAQKRLEATRIDLAPWIDAKTHFVSADRWLDGPETVLQVGSVKLLLHHVGPAHTPEDMVIFDPQSGVMFAGDIVFRGRIPFVGTADSRLWIQSLNKLLALNPRVLPDGFTARPPALGAALELLPASSRYQRHESSSPFSSRRRWACHCWAKALRSRSTFCSMAASAACCPVDRLSFSQRSNSRFSNSAPIVILGCLVPVGVLTTSCRYRLSPIK